MDPGEAGAVGGAVARGETATVVATEGHPFWVPDAGAWVGAGDLKPGQWLQTSAGTWVQVTAVRARTTLATVHNLTVNTVHTNYVLAGDTSVLVTIVEARSKRASDSRTSRVMWV